MSDTRELLVKIKDLRQRLAQVQGLVGEATQAATALLGAEPDGPLEQRVAEGERRQALLDTALRQLSDGMDVNDIRPTRLIARVRRLLEEGRNIVTRLRQLADDPVLSRGDEVLEESADDPLLLAYRETASMAESALRLVQAFPDAPSAQMRLSDGLESIMGAIDQRIDTLTGAANFRRDEAGRRDGLARLLERLKAGEELEPAPFIAIAEGILEESRSGVPLHFLHAPAKRPAEFIACHSLTVARVASRMIRHDPDWQKFTLDVAMAALLKDVGMLTVDPAFIAASEPLTDEQKRALETHCRVGAELVTRHLPAAAPLCEAVMSHHERLDGTGYPSGLKDAQIGPLPRLMALADVYSALCTPRPHRPA
ncbi:MAG: HD-GYP domain-containing protein, partial [Gemmataceae bacterium]